MSAPDDTPAGADLPACEITISQALIDAYAAVSGDFNTVHVDPRAGEAAGFGGTIAHGCIPMEPLFQSIRAWLGTEALPEDTTMRLRYRAPSRPGDRIRSQARVTGEQAAGDRIRVTIAFRCVNQDGTLVIDGDCELTR